MSTWQYLPYGETQWAELKDVHPNCDPAHAAQICYDRHGCGPGLFLLQDPHGRKTGWFGRYIKTVHEVPERDWS